MEPWQSWALITAIVAGAGYYYTKHDQKKGVKGRIQSVSDHVQPLAVKGRPAGKSKRGKDQDSRPPEDFTVGRPAKASSSSLEPISNGDAKKPKKKGKKSGPLQSSAETEMSRDLDHDVGTADDDSEGDDDKAFAKMMSKAQVGTSLARVPGASERKKKKNSERAKGKQSTVDMSNGGASSHHDASRAPHISPDSSTTGVDADDDLSLGYSPDLGATSVTTPSATDVSDMLPPASKGSSVLRITDPVNPPLAKQPKQPKKEPESETKKQRQNRRKKEEAKAARVEGEKERRALLEIQLRTAREAEGRPARNGLGASSAWNKKEKDYSRAAAQVHLMDNQALLDTFGDGQPIIQDSATLKTNGNHQHTAINVHRSRDSFLGDGKPRSDVNDIPSEEEQLRVLGATKDPDAWTTVEKAGKGARKMQLRTANKFEKARGAHKQSDTSTSGRNMSTASELSTAESHDIDMNVNEYDDDVPTNGIADMRMDPSLRMNGQSATSAILAPDSGPTQFINTRSKNLRGGLSEEEIHARIYTKERPKPPADILNDVAIDSSNHPRPIASRWLYLSDREKEKRRAHIKKHLDRKIWNYDNIHVHPDFEPGNAGFDLRFALIGSPMDSDWIDPSDDGPNVQNTGMYRSNRSKWAINGMSRDFDETYPHHPDYTATQTVQKEQRRTDLD